MPSATSWIDGRLSGADALPVAGRNRQRHPRLASVQVRVDRVERGQRIDDGKVLRGLEPRNQLAAGGGPVLVHHDQRHVADVGRGGIAEHRELEERRQDDDAEQARILPELEEFLANEVQDARHWPVAHSRLRRSEASDRTIAANTTSAAMSCQKTETPTPLSTIARSAIRK